MSGGIQPLSGTIRGGVRRAFKRYSEFKVDWLTAVLVSLVVGFQSGAIVATSYISEVVRVPETQLANVEIGVGLIGLIIAESLFIIGVWRLWQRFSRLTQKLLKYGIVTFLLVLALYLSYVTGQVQSTLLALGSACAFFVLVYLLDRFDLSWITFNAFALMLGIGLTSLLSRVVAPIVVIPLLALAIMWDYFAVNLSDIMGELVEFSSSAGIPNYVIIPQRLRVNLDSVSVYLQDADESEKPPGLAGVIGVADFALPAMLAVSGWVGGITIPPLAAIGGTVIAMVVLRDSMSRVDGGLPALPWLNTGALIGFAGGVVLAGIPLSTALGV